MTTLVFGGAFDPPHSEHVGLLKAAAAALCVDRIVIVPTFLPPHKGDGFLSFEQRSELCSLAFSNVGVEVIVDGIEAEEKKDNYSYRILPMLKEKYGDIVFLLGGDSLMYFNTWKNPQSIASCCPIAVVARTGYKDARAIISELEAVVGGEFILLDYVGGDCSSAVIKAKLLLGLKTPELPETVREYIKSNKLFLQYRSMINMLRCIQTPELYAHSVSVVLGAVDMASKHNLKIPFEKIFVAALLHDNAKERLSLDGLSVPSDSIESPVLHQFLGAEKAKRDFGVNDEDILNAIRFHTTAHANMSPLEKLIYTADSLSQDREYEPIPALRKVAMADFERGFKSVLKYTYLKVMAKGKGIYKLTEEAKEFYLH